MVSKAVLLTLVAVLIGCNGQPTVDTEAARSAILAADEAWSQTALDADAFVAFVTDDAVLQPTGAPSARGPDEIRAAVSTVFDAASALQWSPSEADVSACGDLGYSIGSYEQTVNDVETTGKYVTVWKKQADGSWKVAVDAFNENAAAPVVAAAGPAGADPVEVDPDHYSVAFENDQVRVLRIAYGPGERSVMHVHPAGVVVLLTGGVTKFELPDGTEREGTGEAGTAQWAEAEEHLPVAGDEPAQAFLVELKGG